MMWNIGAERILSWEVRGSGPDDREMRQELFIRNGNGIMPFITESIPEKERMLKDMEHRILLIYNPKAGKGQFLSNLPVVIDLFAKAGYIVEVYPTQAPGDAVNKIARIQDAYSMIVPAGGDGTLDEVVTGLIRSGLDIPIGYIPVGSTNDYAASLGLSSNVVEAVGDVIGGIPKRVDAGILNGNHVFIYVAAFGAFTDVAYDTNQDMKNALGHVAYLIEATKRIGGLKPYHMKVESEEFQDEDDYIFGMVTNSISVGGIRNITGKEVLLDDGLFEVILVHDPKNIIDLNEEVTSLLTQNYKTRLVDSFKTSRLVLESDQEVPWTTDGEYGGSFRETVVTDEKERVRMVIDKQKAVNRRIPLTLSAENF